MLELSITFSRFNLLITAFDGLKRVNTCSSESEKLKNEIVRLLHTWLSIVSYFIHIRKPDNTPFISQTSNHQNSRKYVKSKIAN